MECKQVRKKLKDYATDEIGDKGIIQEMEDHIGSCQVCMRELLLWQDVTEKQRALNRMSGGLSDRMDKRMRETNRNIHLPPIMRRVEAMRMFSMSPVVKIIVQVLLLAAALLLMYAATRNGINIFAVILFGIGFMTVIAMMFRKKK
ncbi:MAG: hypothetical protein LLG37_10615 [Spirochaetia bacterium]|nr:hypothetical protein [Spirochaetia bacterium]